MVLLIFYVQLQNQATFFRWATYGTMFINIGASTGIFFASIFVCSPVARGWDLNITTGTCIDRPALYEATAAFGVIVDCLIISIPIPMVLSSRCPGARRPG
jgi:ABC-type proline/glycine betaine transport system permease subunit